MKQNNELIRFILIRAESETAPTFSITAREILSEFPEINQDILDEHIRILVETGFLEAQPTQLYWIIQRLTPAGHNFLQNASDPAVWKKTLQVAGQFTLDVIARILTEVAVKSALRSL